MAAMKAIAIEIETGVLTVTDTPKCGCITGKGSDRSEFFNELERFTLQCPDHTTDWTREG